jgi:glycosyltransferase involved in cell wall biosynthesis
MLDPWFKRTYPLKHVKKLAYWTWGEYRVLRDAAAVVFTCEEERVLARQSFSLYRAKERVVNYGSEPPPPNHEIQQRAFYQRFPALRGKRLCLFLSRIHEKKGCDLAIAAFARVLGRDPSWALAMAGPDEGKLLPGLKELAKREGVLDRITWTGMIVGEEKWGALRSAEILLLPSHQENFGIVVSEALSCGLPVMISDKVNIWREVQADRAGLVGGDNEVGAAQVLTEWVKMSDEQRVQMRASARNCFQRRFSISMAAKDLKRLVVSMSSRGVTGEQFAGARYE